MNPSVLTIGNFDGVHIGHQALVRTVLAQTGTKCRGMAMFFEPHPIAFFKPDAAPPLLTTSARREQLLLAHGLGGVEVRTFDAALAALDAEDFVQRVLLDELRVKAVVVGPDFRFGKGRRGDVALLERVGQLPVTVVPGVQLDGAMVSSTRTREAVRAGDVELVNRLLGRVHELSGTVVRGDQRGRTIGFPTANLDGVVELLPADGVYAVTVRLPDRADLVHGVANVGVRPTFGAGRSFEVHLFDLDEDLYGRELRVGILARIRAERRFSGVTELRAQLGEDVARGREIVDAFPTELLQWI